MTSPEESTRTVVAYLQTTLGLSFTGPRRDRLLATIDLERARSGLSCEEYLAAVSRPGRMFDRLVGEVTVGETYFFRDRAQCDLLKTVVLPAVRDGAAAERSVAMWSAGCASGEEAFTLAALASASGLGDRCDIVGTDASNRAIEKARIAVYGPWSMRSVAPTELAAHFRQENGRFHVADRLRARTRFVQRNLFDGPPPPGRFDVIMCRNLLIYLTADGVERASEVLADALTPNGWLITAAGDPPLKASGLEAVRTPYGLAYRRVRAEVSATGEPTTSPRGDPTQGPAAVPATTRGSGSARPVRAPHAGNRTAGPRPRTDHGDPPAEVLAVRVRSLGDAGRLQEACRAAGEAVRAYPLDVELRYLSAVVLMEAGRLDEAASAASSAVYLGPDLAAAQLLLGQVEHARGNLARARRSLRNGSRLLAAAPGEAPVALAGNVPAVHLAAVAARFLSTQGDVR